MSYKVYSENVKFTSSKTFPTFVLEGWSGCIWFMIRYWSHLITYWSHLIRYWSQSWPKYFCPQSSWSRTVPPSLCRERAGCRGSPATRRQWYFIQFGMHSMSGSPIHFTLKSDFTWTSYSVSVSEETYPNPRSTEVNTFEPVEHVHVLLQVHLPNLAKSCLVMKIVLSLS